MRFVVSVKIGCCILCLWCLPWDYQCRSGALRALDFCHFLTGNHYQRKCFFYIQYVAELWIKMHRILCKYFFLIPANIPYFLYPFLHTVSKTRPFEYLRLTSLGVIGALVKVIDQLQQPKLLCLSLSEILYSIYDDLDTLRFKVFC